MKLFSLTLILAGLSLAPTAAKADLLGSTVTGTLNFSSFPSTNFFSPTTTTIGPAVEFSFTGTANIDSANFGANGVVIDDNCDNGSGAAGSCNLNFAWTMTFTDTAFTGGTFATGPLLNTLGLTYSFSGDVLTLNYDGHTLTSGDHYSTFGFTPAVAATPEPESLVLLGTGLLGMVGVARRRFRTA